MPVDIPELIRPDYRVYPLVCVVADKLCAVMERHGGRPSTRFRDPVDLVLIARTYPIEAGPLRDAIAAERVRRELPAITAVTVPDERVWAAG